MHVLNLGKEMQLDAWDVIIVGAGAAGLMCAITAGKRGRRVLVLESADRPGKKILMSGGGRCTMRKPWDNYFAIVRQKIFLTCC